MNAKRIKVLGLLGLPLLAIAVAVMVFTFGNSPGTAEAADLTIGQSVSQDSGVMPVAGTDCAVSCMSIQPDSAADVTIGITGDDNIGGPGPWTIDVTYDDSVVQPVDISPATTTFDDDSADSIGIGSSVIVNDDTGSGLSVSSVAVAEDPAATDISGLGLTTGEGQGISPVLYVAATVLGLTILAIAISMTTRTRRVFAGGTLSGGQHQFRQGGQREQPSGHTGFVHTVTNGVARLITRLATTHHSQLTTRAMKSPSAGSDVTMGTTDEQPTSGRQPRG